MENVKNNNTTGPYTQKVKTQKFLKRFKNRKDRHDSKLKLYQITDLS